MRYPLSVKSKSVETSGIPRDYKEALCEYVWNGFEANATTISITHTINVLGGIEEICISDNGSGICFETIQDTFGAFLASQKNALSLKIKSKVNQGKGRFAGFSFANRIKWDTVCAENGKNVQYSISVYSENKNEYEVTEKALTERSTGTTVIIGNVDQILPEQVTILALEDTLLKEFAWYLYLNKERNVEILVNGERVDYTKYIDTRFSAKKDLLIDGIGLKIDVVVWKEKIREKFCIYFMNLEGVLKGRDTTSFNRNTVNFNHSVFVRSLCFDRDSDTSLTTDDSGNEQIAFDDQPSNRTFLRKVKKEIQEAIDDALTAFLSAQATKAVQDMMDRESFPTFSDDIPGQLQKKDLMTVTQELYKLDARIFYKLKPIQEKSLLGFINLLLQSEERENMLDIIESIVSLTPEQRKGFSDILKRTQLGNIIDTIQFIEDRYKVVEALKQVVFDYTDYANERDHVQKIVEQHYWLFGEQYNLVTADQRMQKALANYLNILYGSDAPDATLNPDQEEMRRMDIFLCGARKTEDSVGDEIQENLVIELKAPKVVLTKKVLRQIEDYMDFVRKQPQFNTQLCRWRFIAVCNNVDDDVRARYATKQTKGKKGLVFSVENYELYALTWADVFKSFELRHSFLLKKLKIDQEAIEKDISQQLGNSTGREAVNNLTALALPVSMISG